MQVSFGGTRSVFKVLECFLFAVLSELDELKKNSDRARNVIRWLEQEFRRGNRHMRSQRDNESQSLSFLKIPKKLGMYRADLFTAEGAV